MANYIYQGIERLSLRWYT